LGVDPAIPAVGIGVGSPQKKILKNKIPTGVGI
jgi:hypothetical protein